MVSYRTCPLLHRYRSLMVPSRSGRRGRRLAHWYERSEVGSLWSTTSGQSSAYISVADLCVTSSRVCLFVETDLLSSATILIPVDILGSGCRQIHYVSSYGVYGTPLGTSSGWESPSLVGLCYLQKLSYISEGSTG